MVERPLFRPEVVHARRGEWLGTIIVAAPLSRWLLAGCAAGATIALILFCLFFQYTRRETVFGQLVPSAGVLNVVALTNGTVGQLKVKDGQQVKAGDFLLEVSSDHNSETLGETHVEIKRQLELQRRELELQISNQKLDSAQQKSTLEGRLVLLKQQRDQVAQQIVIARRQSETAQAMLDRLKPLEKTGYISSLQIQQQQATVYEGLSQLKSLERQKLDAQQQIDNSAHELEQLPLVFAAKRGLVEQQLGSVAQAIAENEGSRAIVFRAPADGIVSIFSLQHGQMVATGQPLLSILPSNAKLQALLVVPSRAIGFAQARKEVVIRFQAFPYQKFGRYIGSISDVSRSALSLQEATALSGQSLPQGSRSFYGVRVDLTAQQIPAGGEVLSLRSGMEVEADLMLERRSLFEWLFEPLFGVGQKPRVGSDG